MALDMKLYFTSGYYPKKESQTKHINQTLKQYLHIYCNYQQDNWSDLLLLAEFVYNNILSTTIEVSPFFTNKEYHLNITINLERDIALSHTHEFAVDLNKLQDVLKTEILAVQQKYQRSADAHRIPGLDFQVRQQVYIKA